MVRIFSVCSPSPFLRLNTKALRVFGHFLPGSAASFTLHRCCLILSLFVSRVLCCPVCWGTSHFSTFASDHENGKYACLFPVFAVFRRLRLCFLCASVPCDKLLCGRSGLPCGWGTLPCGWGYSYCGRGNSPRSCNGLPCGKGHAQLCSTSDLQVHSDWVIGRLPFHLQ